MYLVLHLNQPTFLSDIILTDILSHKKDDVHVGFLIMTYVRPVFSCWGPLEVDLFVLAAIPIHDAFFLWFMCY